MRAWLRTSTATGRTSQWRAAVRGTPCLLGSDLPLFLFLSLLSHQPAQAQIPGTAGIESVLADRDGDGQPDRLLEAVTVTGVLAADFWQGPGYSQTHVQDSQRGIELLLLDQVPPELEAIIGTGAQTQPLSPDAYSAGDVVRVRGQLIEAENRIQVLVTGMERVGGVAPPAPRETAVEELLAGRHQDVLVTVSGRLVATPEGPEQARLVGESGSIPVRIGADLMADAAFGPRLSEGAAMTLTGFAEPLRRGGELQYRLAIDERSDFIVQPRPPSARSRSGRSWRCFSWPWCTWPGAAGSPSGAAGRWRR